MAGNATPIGRLSHLQRMSRWALGMPMTALRYAAQRVPMYRRRYEEGGLDDPSLPDANRKLPGDPETLHRATAGVGPLFHRRYTIFLTDEKLNPEELIRHIADNPNEVTPSRMARFETFSGELARELTVGDELVVRLPGPWDGPVRVVDRTPTSFRLATLQSHMEAGEIEFSSGYDDRGFLRFQIESWARSGDRLFWWLYDRFPLGREMQLHMWSQFCQHVGKVSGGTPMSHVTVFTRRLT